MNRIEKVEPPDKVRGFGIVGYIREDLDILSVIFVLALFLRIYLAVILVKTMSADLVSELEEIDKSVFGGGLNAMQPPLYALFLRIVYAIFGAYDHQVVFIVQGILSSVMVLFMYLTGRLLFGRGAGILAAAISAIYPNFIVYNLELNPDSISLVIVVLLMTTAVLQSVETGKAFLSAALIGVGILFKPLLVYFLPGMLLTVKKRILFIVLVVVILAPWAIRNSVVQGSFTPVYETSAYKVDLRHFTHRYQKWEAVHKIYSNCAEVLKRSWTSSYADDEDGRLRNSSYIATYSHVIIMLLGLAGIIRYRRREQLGAVAPVVGYLILLVVLSDFKIKYRIYFEPLLILYTAVIVSRLDFLIWKKMKSLRLRGSGES
jgi:4-amino-4-deoxy-L-arabinose transferase-like glycosyltransferase